MSIIYQPAGKAREYADWAANLFRGCSHGCVYCFAPKILYMERDKFKCSKTRPELFTQMRKDLKKIPSVQTIHLCFTCDPYQEGEEFNKITRLTIMMLKEAGHHIRILTKAGPLAQRDFDLLDNQDWFGQTLTCDNPQDSLAWEPGAAMPFDRIDNLKAAREKGIRTWVSLEPVIYVDQVFRLIEQTKEFIDVYKVGVLNYHPHSKTIDWPKFAREVKAKLESVGAKYYLKQDLQKYLVA